MYPFIFHCQSFTDPLHFHTTYNLHDIYFVYLMVSPSFLSFIQAVSVQSVIVQVIIYHCSFSLGGHLKTSLLAKSWERVVNIQLTSLCSGPQGAKARWSSGDVHIVVVVRWWVWVWVGGNRWLLLLGRRCASRSPGTRGEPTGWGRHLVFCKKDPQ